jgi:hypothetical protein
MKLALVTAAILVLLAAPVLAATDPTKPSLWQFPLAPAEPLEDSVRIRVDLLADGQRQLIDGLILEPAKEAAGPTVCGPQLPPAGAA